MREASQILTDLSKGTIHPVYFLSGEEPYFIDQISNWIEQNLLEESERSFNQLVLYGRDVTIEDIVGHAKRFPMMAERQVVIVKEAQSLSRSIEQLTTYVANPQLSTVLVIAYKGKTLDGRKGLAKAVKKNGVLYQNKKLYDNQVDPWLRNRAKSLGLDLDNRVIQLLVEYLGSDLGRIDSELKKLKISAAGNLAITPEIIQTHIGINKDYNNFELRRAVGEKDAVKAHRIINYYRQNPKQNPLVLTLSSLYGFYSNLLMYHGLPQKSKAIVAKTLGINPFFVQEYVTAARNYPIKNVSKAISFIREADAQSKGVGGGNFRTADLKKHDVLQELLAKLFAL